MRHRERQRHRQREKQAPCREPNTGLDPRVSRIRPCAEGSAKSLSQRGCPMKYYLKKYFLFKKIFFGERKRVLTHERAGVGGVANSTRSREPNSGLHPRTQRL